MKTLNLTRRSVIKGAGSLAIPLPWLEATAVQAQTNSHAKRLVTVYTPGGTVRDKWQVAGSETDYTLSPILTPLENIKDEVLILHGIDMKSASGGPHQGGMVALLTGTGQSGSHNKYASGPSIDQVIANRIGGDSPKSSVQFAIRWATGKTHGLLHPMNAIFFEDNDSFSPIPPRIDPQALWTDLFGSIDTSDPEAAARLQRKKSVLDFVNKRYTNLSAALGYDDRARLEQHLTKIRELEASLANIITVSGSACGIPTKIDTSDYNPFTGLNSANDGSVRDISTDAAIPKVGKWAIDMLVFAMACDITNVTSLQWTDIEAKHTFPWLNLTEHHHYYQHDGGYRPAELEIIYRWYAEQHAYLLQQMASVNLGDHSLLDESVVFFGSEISHPSSHRKDDMPFLLAGRGGGLRPGRKLEYNSASHNDLLIAILGLFGEDRNSFGNPGFSSGALTGLT